LHALPVGLMWGVGPVTGRKLNEAGIQTIGQLAALPGKSLESLVGVAAGQKLAALAWNRDPRVIASGQRARSVGAQSALGKQAFGGRVVRPTLRHLADRICSRMRAKGFAGRTVTARVRFADMRAVTRSVTLGAPVAATAILTEVAEELVETVRRDHRQERWIT